MCNKNNTKRFGGVLSSRIIVTELIAPEKGSHKMFGLEYVLALIKILFNIGFAIVTALPFHFAWVRLAPKFFSFLPKIWIGLSYWEMVGILLISMFVGDLIQRLTPKFVNVTQNNTNDTKTKAG